MTDRLNKIFSELESCKIFADVGCDHGYMAKAMISSGKAQKVIISDVSAKCLTKAQELLKEELLSGKAESVVSNGFEKVGKCDLALVAGMGGEEIIGIINNAPFLPERLVLQPMKNADKVRICAVKHGYKILKDYVFYSAGAYYDLIVLEKGEDALSQDEIEFGRTNIKEPSKAFTDMLKIKMQKLAVYAEKDGLSQDAKQDILTRKQRLEKYVKD
ncbi:MAG: SAM-dependent methyltransferase [Clostridia bacterium]|nr:SAM-dependent methyltransferase [Clostridia bacterium]